MVSLKAQPRKSRGLDIAPLVDIVFLLLIFFMLTSTFIRQEGMDIELPKAESSESFDMKSIKIQVQENGTLMAGDKKVGFEELKTILGSAVDKDSSVPIIIEADKKTDFDMFAKILDLARLLGASNIVIATDPLESTAS
ncbi:putative Biopolymer transport protein ExbD [Nitrospina gracilis 3/211]|uniref:Putative Biopolymer transport protein ExbD n=1 Tax=Nitrospina gracilis (strain 3/211) TaxID=1266370 RepID=M1Z953_NITG3|nr:MULTISPECIES: biopolymer transporter ExbD [Nitrospina]MCF8722699.1 biopolymer transport protein ExbD [Nitrospina sp. Nb-3]CCQ89641.1 putative Biopolymer transport protein ExbD [Nitrospina gracilis 3/211]